MKLKNYSILKAASKVSFSKDGESYLLTEKQYDAETGEELSSIQSVVKIDDYKHQKAELEKVKTNTEAKITEITQIITDLESL